MSIYQSLSGRVDVLSTGSQNARITTELAEQIGQWERVYLWCDQDKTLQQWRRAIGDNVVRGWTSPLIDDRKMDANSILLRGELADFMVAKAKAQKS